MSPGQLTQLRELAEQVAVREGCLLYDLEFAGSSRTLRVFIEKNEGGVSIEDCTNVSRGLNLLLDVEDLIPGGAYDLEVSSPGLERKLTQPWHFAKAVGQTIKLTYRDEIGKIQSYDGILREVKESSVVFENAKGLKEFALDSIEKARVVFVETKQGKPGHKPGVKKR